jgi:hypothetical protein
MAGKLCAVKGSFIGPVTMGVLLSRVTLYSKPVSILPGFFVTVLI